MTSSTSFSDPGWPIISGAAASGSTTESLGGRTGSASGTAVTSGPSLPKEISREIYFVLVNDAEEVLRSALTP